jgi:hypothetical protein
LFDVSVAFRCVFFAVGVAFWVDEEEAALDEAVVRGAPLGVAPALNGFIGELCVDGVGIVGADDARGVDGGSVGVGNCGR